LKVYEITIKPLSGFGTLIKGDTLFGHICWQAAYNDGLFGRPLRDLLKNYAESPFLIVSSAYPRVEDKIAFKRPDMPLDALFDFTGMTGFQVIKERKTYKQKKWMLVRSVGEDISIRNMDFISDTELFEKCASNMEWALHKESCKSFIAMFSQMHNTINRLTGTTGTGMFAPYAVDQTVYMPDINLIVYAALDDSINIEQVADAMKRIGESGYGKDASTGLGRFEVVSTTEVSLSGNRRTANACYTISPCVPEKDKYRKTFFAPFVRFGRHGDVYAKSAHPFKNPVIMADEGAVFIPASTEVFEKPYIGTAVTNISKTDPGTVMQGYSLYLPVEVEV
jgi:CRISPR-associated protein Csm4